jgi:hypothetical protein
LFSFLIFYVNIKLHFCHEVKINEHVHQKMKSLNFIEGERERKREKERERERKREKERERERDLKLQTQRE